MNKLIIGLLLCSFQSFATTYYVKLSGGTGSGLNDANAWNYAKFNATATASTDSVLFNRGEVYFGEFNARSNSNYGAYGIGANPIISGFSSLSSWTLSSGNIYYAALTKSALNLVTVDGVVKPMGRFPNTGFLNYESHTGNTSITDNQLTGSPSWTGAEVVIRKDRWIIDRHTITNHATSTLTYSISNTYGNNGSYSPINGNGYIIQNHLSTLDQEGEWFFDAGASRLYMHFGSGTPSGKVVKAGTVDTLLNLISKSNITFNNIDFEGSNLQAASMIITSNVAFTNCSFRQHGGSAIVGAGGISGITITGGTYSDILNNGIWIQYGSTNSTVNGVTMNNVGTIYGAGMSADGVQQGIAISGNGTTVMNCTVSNIGYNGINFNGSTALIEQNYVDNFCVTKDDGGGIYSYLGTDTAQSNRIVRKNIVLNANGAYLGAEGSGQAYGKAAALYMDGYANHTSCDSNVLANGTWNGILINNNSNNSFTNNIVYNFSTQFFLNGSDAVGTVRNTTITGNQFVAKTSIQKCLYLSLASTETVSLLGTFNNNVYARPIDDNLTITVDRGGVVNHSLATWKSTYSQDAASTKSPLSITDVSRIRLDYNISPSAASIALGSLNYQDFTGALKTGIRSIPAYYGSILIRTNSAKSAVNSGGKIIKINGKRAVIIQ